MMTEYTDEQALVVPDTPSLSPANLFDLPGFIETQPTRRVADLCAALRQTRTLGLLIGLPGVGKTWAAQSAA
jgi:DNA transposition AAA+ family ATPase